MVRVLISALPFTRGDVNPYLAITRALVRAGHEVDWMSLPDGLGEFTELVELAGGQVWPSPPSPIPPLPRREALAKILADQTEYVRLVRIPLPAAVAQVDYARTLLRERRIDVVATDRGLEFAPLLIAAELEGVPHAFVCAGLHLLVSGGGPPPSESVRIAAMSRWIEFRKLFRHFGLTPTTRGDQLVSRALNTCFTTAACVGDIDLPPNIVLIGPCLSTDPEPTAFPWDRLRTDGRIVYVAFGSLYADAATYRRVAEAAAPLDVQLVISTGHLADSLARELPDALCIAYAPQLELLARASVFVTHGGLNSVNEALFYGVPMLVVPRAVDQGLQASVARTAGFGIVCDDREPSVDDLRRALVALLAPDSSYRDSARRIRASYRLADGVHEACDRIVELATRRALA